MSALQSPSRGAKRHTLPPRASLNPNLNFGLNQNLPLLARQRPSRSQERKPGQLRTNLRPNLNLAPNQSPPPRTNPRLQRRGNPRSPLLRTSQSQSLNLAPNLGLPLRTSPRMRPGRNLKSPLLRTNQNQHRAASLNQSRLTNPNLNHTHNRKNRPPLTSPSPPNNTPRLPAKKTPTSPANTIRHARAARRPGQLLCARCSFPASWHSTESTSSECKSCRYNKDGAPGVPKNGMVSKKRALYLAVFYHRDHCRRSPLHL